MKIALVRKTYTPYGGAERYLAQLIQRLGHQGHAVHIFASRWDQNAPKSLGKEGKINVFFHRVPSIRTPSFLEALSFALFAKHLLQEESFDIIHSFERTLYQDIYRAGDGCHREWLIQRKKIDPWTKRLSHPVNPLHTTLLFLERKLFQSPRLKRVIANSQRGKEEIIRHYGVLADKIEVIYNGVDLNLFNPLNVELYREKIRKEYGILQEAFVVLFLGSGFRRKGLDVLIASLPQWIEKIPHAILLVAGKDRPRRYRKKARRLGMEDKIRFLGPTQRARELYAASDLFVLPTIYEPFSNACLEAMATGLPVVTTSINGIAELIEDRQNGFLVRNPSEPQEISAAVNAFYHFPRKAEIREKARVTSSRFDIESAVQRMLQIYGEIKNR